MKVIDFCLPSLGADMESATLTAWLKHLGESVRREEALATVETDKGLIDIESFEDGTLTEILVQPGTKLRVGTPLARLSVAGEAPVVPGPAERPVPPRGAAAQPLPAAAPVAPGDGPPAQPRARVSPAARRRAQELGISLKELERAASGGIVHLEDVEGLAAGHDAPPVDAKRAMRAAIGAAMARAKREIPHYYLSQALDFGPAQAWLTAHNAPLAVKDRLLDTVLLAKAIAQAAARIEGFNGYFREGRFEPAASVHVGCAIAARGGGLVAPALLDAQRKDLHGLMQQLSALVTRVRAGHLKSSEFAAATITLTSLGSEGADALYPIINPPQVAIIGAGAICERPWVHEGGLAIRPVLNLTLAADHRVTDGRAGARFLRAIADALGRPESLS